MSSNDDQYLSVKELVIGGLYQLRSDDDGLRKSGLELYKTGDLYDPALANGPVTLEDNIFIVSVLEHSTYDYFAVKVIASEKFGWFFVQDDERLFRLMTSHETEKIS